MRELQRMTLVLVEPLMVLITDACIYCLLLMAPMDLFEMTVDERADFFCVASRLMARARRFCTIELAPISPDQADRVCPGII